MNELMMKDTILIMNGIIKPGIQKAVHKKNMGYTIYVFSKHISGLHTAYWPRDAFPE